MSIVSRTYFHHVENQAILAKNRPKINRKQIGGQYLPIETYHFSRPHRTSTETIAKCAGAVKSWVKQQMSQCHQNGKQMNRFTSKILKFVHFLFPPLLKFSTCSINCISRETKFWLQNVFTDAVPLLIRSCGYVLYRVIQRIHCLKTRRWNVTHPAETSSYPFFVKTSWFPWKNQRFLDIIDSRYTNN